MFPGPSIKLPPMDALPLGAQVAVTGEQDSFAALASGGYVPKNHLAVLGTHEQDFVAVAERFAGTPYLWGGKSSLGIDCSGLVQVALNACGIPCPRDSDMQEARARQAREPCRPASRRPDLLERPRRHRARPQQHDPRQRVPHGGDDRAGGRCARPHRRDRQPGHQREAAEMKLRALFLLCMMLIGGTARADDYPTKSIRLIVPFAAGGAVGAVARVLSNPLSQSLGQSIVIDNRGGAGGIIGMDAVAKAPPDGYTVLLIHSGITYMPGLYRKLPFDPATDFDGVVAAVSGSFVLAVSNNTPFKTVAELIAYAKANPGRLSYGSAGIGSTLHLASEFFKRAAAIDMIHVPYKGASQATTDLVAGQIQVMIGPAVALMPLAQAGNVRALAVPSLKRSPLAPELAHDDRKRRAGLRGHELVRARGTGRNAEGRRAEAQYRDQQCADPAGVDRAVPAARLRAAGRDARRYERADQGRHGALDQDHPRRRHRTAIETFPKDSSKNLSQRFVPRIGPWTRTSRPTRSR